MNTEHTHNSLRRAAPRFPVIAPLELDLPGGRIVGGTVVNLSLSGLYCLLDESVDELTPVTVRTALAVTMPDSGHMEIPGIEIPALVVRIEHTDRRIAAALMFGELPIESEWVIGRHILETFDGVTQGCLRRPEAGATLR